MIFSSFSWRHLLIFIIHEPGLGKYCTQCTASMPIYSCVHQKILPVQHIYVHLFLPCITLFLSCVSLMFIVFLPHTTRINVLWNVFHISWVSLIFIVFLITHHKNCFVLWNVFHIRDRDIPYTTLHQTALQVFHLETDVELCKHTRCSPLWQP